MAIVVITNNPNTLLQLINQAIDRGDIETWVYDQDGDYTHTPPQWTDKAWLSPVVQQGALLFGITGRKEQGMTKAVYGVYHGRFVEMLLVHFDNFFSSIQLTALGDSSIDSFK